MVVLLQSSFTKSAMSEEDGVEVCHVCQEIFLEEAPLKSHMQESHPDVEQQCKSEGGRAERHSTVVAKLERQISLHRPGRDLAEERESIKEGLQKVG